MGDSPKSSRDWFKASSEASESALKLGDSLALDGLKQYNHFLSFIQVTKRIMGAIILVSFYNE